MRGLPPALALAGLLLAACAASPAPRPPAAASPRPILVAKDLPNGRVELAVRPAYPRGGAVAVGITVTASRGSVTAPTRARVLASGIGEAGTPSEVLVRELTVAPLTAVPGAPRTATLTWDGRDLFGTIVPADAYSLVVDLVSDDGTVRAATVAATIEVVGN